MGSKLNIEWSKNSDRVAEYEKDRLERDQKAPKMGSHSVIMLEDRHEAEA